MAKGQYQREKQLALTNAFWKNVPVVDADSPIKVFPRARHLAKAIPGDPENCVYAQCIKEGLGIRRVRVWREVALVEHIAGTAGVDSNGRPYKKSDTIALRYKINLPGQRAVINLDQGVGDITPCMFKAPAPSERLNKQKEYDHKHYPNRREKHRAVQKLENTAKAKGTYVPNLKYQRKHMKDLGIRDGSGHSYRTV
jgi:hypothetical protein